MSKRPHDVAAARRFLVEIAETSRRGLTTYGDVAASYGGIPRAVGPVLQRIRHDCAAAGEPDLSALVVRSETRLPGDFNDRPVEPGSDNETAWRLELQRIRSYAWGSRGPAEVH